MNGENKDKFDSVGYNGAEPSDLSKEEKLDQGKAELSESVQYRVIQDETKDVVEEKSEPLQRESFQKDAGQSGASQNYEEQGSNDYHPPKKEKNDWISSFKKISFILLAFSVLGSAIGFSYRYSARFFSNSGNVKAIVASENSPQQVTLDAKASSDKIAEIAEKYSPAVVSVVYSQKAAEGLTSAQVIGTGVVFNEDEDYIYIVSNQHVVYDVRTNKYNNKTAYEREGEISIAFEDDGKIYHAEVMGSDTLSDIAVVKVEKDGISKEFLDSLIPVTFADSDKVKVGEWVVAMGNPLGYVDTTTFGIVSGLDRRTAGNNNGLQVRIIQLDAAINSGNSGGAAFNLSGELVGINSMKIKETGVEGIGFAIASNDVKNVIDQIMENGVVQRPFLGIQGGDINDNMIKLYGLPKDAPKGILVTGVYDESGALKAGIESGDIIIEFDEEKNATMEALSSKIKSMKVGDALKVKVFRSGFGNVTINVILGARGSN